MKNYCSEILKPYVYLTPALIVLVGLFLGGVVLALVQSLGYFPAIGMEKLTLQYYYQVVNRPGFWASLRTTIYIALVSTLLSTVTGVYLANYVAQCSSKSKLVSICYKLPITVPHLVAALMLIFLLSQGGLIARLLLKIGLIENISEFPALFYSRNAIGIILIYWWKGTPFVAVMVYAVMNNIIGKLGDAAATLGANSRQVFYHVVLPLSMPSIVSASVLVFAYAFGSFEIPYLLGVSYPKTMPVWAYMSYISPQLSDRPEAMVINVLVSVISICLIAIYYVSMRKYFRQWS